MSLVCHNCSRDMGPSETLPGREGTIVYPQVLSFIWVVEESASEKWVIRHTQAPCNRSLCFRCIADKLPDNQQPVLRAVYEAYEAEIKYRRNEESQRGKMISGEELAKGPKLHEEWLARLELIPTNRCIFCNTKLPDKKTPHFDAVVIDRVYSEGYLSWFNQNYSWSNFKTGGTGFSFCFECCRKNFLPLFEQFSYDLRGVKKTTRTAKSAIFFGSSFIEGLKTEVGEERALEMLQEFPEGVEKKIIIDTEGNRLSSN